MSQETVEIVRRANAAFNRGDYDAFQASIHPEIGLRDLNNAADVPERLQGAQAFRALLADWKESFEDLKAEVSEFVDADRYVVCVTHWIGRGKSSEAIVDTSQVDVFELEDGKIIQVTLAYPDKASALEAVGLSDAS